VTTRTGQPQAGETIEVLLKASDNTGHIVHGGHGTASFWAPGSPPDAEPDRTVDVAWDDRQRAYVAVVHTSGWEPGTYAVRGEVRGHTASGPARGWSPWVSLTLAPSLFLPR
jgi:hypothetical protein